MTGTVVRLPGFLAYVGICASPDSCVLVCAMNWPGTQMKGACVFSSYSIICHSFWENATIISNIEVTGKKTNVTKFNDSCTGKCCKGEIQNNHQLITLHWVVLQVSSDQRPGVLVLPVQRSLCRCRWHIVYMGIYTKQAALSWKCRIRPVEFGCHGFVATSTSSLPRQLLQGFVVRAEVRARRASL